MADTVFRVRATDMTGGATKSATKNFAGVTGGLGSLTGAGLAAGAALAGLGAVQLGQLIGDLEKSEQTISRITGLTGPDVAPWTELATVIGGSVPQGLDLVSQAVGTARTRFGELDPAIERVAREGLALNEIFGVDVRGTMQDVTDASRLFGETTGGQVADNLADLGIVALRTDTNIADLIGGLATYGPVLTQFGLGFDESAAFLGLLNSAGIDASRVFPGLNAFLRTLAAEGIEDTKGALIGAIATIKGATSETEALDLATKLFGAEGAVRLTEAIRGTGEAGGVIGAMDQWVAGMSTDPDSLINTIIAADNTVQTFAANTRTSTDQMNIAWNRFRLNFAGVGLTVNEVVGLNLSHANSLIGDFGLNWRVSWLGLQYLTFAGLDELSGGTDRFAVFMQNRFADLWNEVNIRSRGGLSELATDLRGFQVGLSIPGFRIPNPLGDDFVFGGFSQTFRPFSGLSVTRSGGLLNYARPTYQPQTSFQEYRRQLRDLGADNPLLRDLIGLPPVSIVPRTPPERPVVPTPISPLTYLEGQGEAAAPQVVNHINVEITGDTYGLENLDDRVIEAVQEGIRQGEVRLN